MGKTTMSLHSRLCVAANRADRNGNQSLARLLAEAANELHRYQARDEEALNRAADRLLEALGSDTAARPDTEGDR